MAWDWEAVDMDERRVIAVGALSDVMLARYEYVSAQITGGLMPTRVEVRACGLPSR